MSTHMDIPRPGDSGEGLSDEEALTIISRIADNLELAQEELRMVTAGSSPSTEAAKRNLMHSSVANAHAATAQSLALYLLICSALDD